MESGKRVRALAQYNSMGSWGWLDAVDERILSDVEVVLGDVRDAESMKALADGVDLILHLAALIAIPYSYRAPRSYLETNTLGTLNVLEAARVTGTPRVVITSTSEVYGTARRVPIDESHPLQAQSPYSASKVAADKVAESYWLSFGLPVVTLRPFNTFGPRQSARAVIPTIVTQLAAGAPMLRLGSLEPTRDFTFVTDTVAAFAAVSEARAEDVVGRVLNAGTNTEISIRSLAELIMRLMGVEVGLDHEERRVRPDTSEVLRLVCDSSELQRLTGWRPATSLEDGLRATIAWFTNPDNLRRYRWTDYNV